MASPPGPPPPEHSEPQERYWHWSAIVDGKQYTYGGYCGAGRTPTLTAVHVFNNVTELWQETPTSGEPPPGFAGASCATIGARLFHFGGDDGTNYHNTIHCLDINSGWWISMPATNLQEAPMPKASAGMLVYENILIVSGGYGELPEHPDPEKYVPDPDPGYEGKGWTNEVHCFHVDSSELC